MRSGSTVLLGAFLFVQNPQAPPPPPMAVDRIAEDFYVVRGEGGNTSVYLNIDYNNGGSLRDAIRTVEQVLKLDFDTVVPGHGPLVKKADIARWHQGLQRMQTRVSAALREGKAKQDVSDILVKEFGWDATGNPLRNVLDGLMAELKP